MAADRQGTDHALERLVFFSDAVFAIAITLLIIEIHPPHLESGASDADHLRALAQLIPNFVGYFVSFAVVGAFWMGHHRGFALASRYSNKVLGWNMAMLATVAFMPFSTAYFSANTSERVPTIFYCTTLLVAALLNMTVNRIATGPHMVGAHASAQDIFYVRRRSLSVVLGALTAVTLSIIAPVIGQVGLISIPLWRLLVTRTGRPAAA